MDFFGDNSQIIVIGIAIVTLILAFVFFYSGKTQTVAKSVKKSPQPEAQPDQMQMSVDPEQQLPPRTMVPNGVLVMFFAPWCGHCKTTGPAWDELTQNFDGYNGVKILKINGDEQQDLAKFHGVGGYPTIKFCPGGLENPDGILYQGDRSVASLAQFLQQNA